MAPTRSKPPAGRAARPSDRESPIAAARRSDGKSAPAAAAIARAVHVPTAIAHLQGADPVIAELIARVAARPPKPRREGSHFDAVARAIVYQQLSGKAAGTIYGRLLGRFGGRPPTPDELRAAADEELRAVGLSRQKLGYLKNLAAHAATGAFDDLHQLPDEAVIEVLTRVKGVGRWTAQMFLLFRLGRPDVLAETDLGVRKAVQLAYRLRQMPSPEKVLKIGARWRPFASVACWYLWRSLEQRPTI